MLSSRLTPAFPLRRFISTGESLLVKRYTDPSRIGQQHIVRTLDRNRLKREDFVDLTRKDFSFEKRVRIAVKLKNGNLLPGYVQFEGRDRFPPGTKGFFYYYYEPMGPILQNGVRFRITQSPDPGSFQSGRDLIRSSNRAPWTLNIRALSIAQIGRFMPLRELAIQDDFLQLEDFEKTGLPSTPKVRTISTLDRKLLKPSDCLHISGRREPEFRRHDPPHTLSRIFYGSAVFPPKTTGFLYFHHDERLPILTGKLRFRLVPSGNPEHFDQGKDLQSLRGEPWNMHAFQIADQWKDSLGLNEQLFKDGQVDFAKAVFEIVRRIPNGGLQKSTKSQALYYLEQPFVVDRSKKHTKLALVTPERLERIKVTGLFPDMVSKRKSSGRVVVRFEKIGDSQDPKKFAVHARVLKFIDPISPAKPGARVGEIITTADGLNIQLLKMNDGSSDTRGYQGLKCLPRFPHIEPNLDVFEDGKTTQPKTKSAEQIQGENVSGENVPGENVPGETPLKE
ncbi:hypothetical protein H0H92_008880 [Tricholoma furcatifolium]|nr:hypothetical protein H0H92_008880 [Tricholoma furcatifolium]